MIFLNTNSSPKTIRELRDRIELFEKNSPDVSAEASFVREGFGENFSENGESSPISTTVVEINSATDHLKQTADLICESLTQFMDHISSSCISVAVEAAQLPSADADAAERETRDAFKEEETEKKEEHTGEKPFEQIIDSIFSDTEKIETNAKEEKMTERIFFPTQASSYKFRRKKQ